MTVVVSFGATGCDGGSNEAATGTQSAPDTIGGGVDNEATDTAPAVTDGVQTRLRSVCRGPETRLRALAEQASVFEEVHSVTETPAKILDVVATRAAATKVHPDDCLGLIKAHALRRSGCHPGVRTYPWMGCDFYEERPPAGRS